MPIQTVGVVGLGLIGGSFGLALRQAGFNGNILGVSEPRYTSIALERGAITAVSSLEEVAAVTDLIYLAGPVDGILHTLETLGPLADERCLITDAGSTKRRICEQARRFVRRASFIGGHPMAGKEKRGIQEAEAGLFDDCAYVLTPAGTRAERVDEFEHWLIRMRVRVLRMDPSEHDRAVAFTSHLPQLLSTALASTVRGEYADSEPSVFGRGLLDMTRLAASSPDLWASIVETNRDEIMEAIASFEDHLASLKQSLVNNTLANKFHDASSFAELLRNSLYKN